MDKLNKNAKFLKDREGRQRGRDEKSWENKKINYLLQRIQIHHPQGTRQCHQR